MSKWYIGAGEQSDIVISTRIRLARNADEYPFPAKLDVKSRTALNKKICDALLNDSEYPLSYIEMKTLTQAEAVSLAERHLISPEFASSTDGRGLLLSENEEISIMLCEEDHIRIQVIKTGFAPEEAYKIADALDNKLNAQIQYAFDERLGYLTQCPTNLGTGMRASVMLHLPALAASNRINRIASTVSKLGLTIRGAYGEGTAAMGDLYQLSNQVTLGISEKAAIDNLRAITLQLAAQERAARTEMIKDISAEDSIYRAYGILKSARILSTREFMELISHVRLGAVTGLLKVPVETVNELMVSMQPATINALLGKRLDNRGRDIERARIIRERL